MLLEHWREPVLQALNEARRALDVTEHECDDARREIATHGQLTRPNTQDSREKPTPSGWRPELGFGHGECHRLRRICGWRPRAGEGLLRQGAGLDLHRLRPRLRR